MSCCGAEKVNREYHSAAAGLGFLVSFMKTKLLVAVYGSVTEEDQLLKYLGSQMTSDGKLDTEVEKHMAGSSRGFSALCHAVFQNRTLSIITKKLVYQVSILRVPLYREHWTPYR